MKKTFYPKAGDINHRWYFVDASGHNLGRLASRIATVLLGKHKPTYTPGVDTGDYVIVLNCGGITVTGNKLEEKMYYRHSRYPGGLKSLNLRQQLEKHPERVIRQAVWGMLPHNKYGRDLLKKLKIYSGSEHPHQAQQPEPLEI